MEPKFTLGFPGGSDGKVSAYNAGDLGSIPGGPVIRTLCFHCREQESITGQGTKIPHAAQPKNK